MALQPPTDRPVKRSSKGGKKMPPLTGQSSARGKIIQKGPDGTVFAENTRGRAIPRGKLSDGHTPTSASRPLGGSRKTRGEVR
jgi:hypothetical protein